eukprot:evm.model.scf_4660.1 EVM.evm.TU.scf_4660.1   scf_4660:213-958(+)
MGQTFEASMPAAVAGPGGAPGARVEGQSASGGQGECFVVKNFFVCGLWNFEETVETLMRMLAAPGVPVGEVFVEETRIFDPNQCKCAAELNATFVVPVENPSNPEMERAALDDTISRVIVQNEDIGCVVRNRIP